MNQKAKALNPAEVAESNGNPMKVGAIQEQAEKAEKAKAAAESKNQFKYLGDNIEFNGVVFYQPTARHKWYLSTILNGIDPAFNLPVTAYILATPGPDLRKKIYSEFVQKELETNSIDFSADLGTPEVIADIINELLGDDDEPEDDGEDSDPKK